MSDLRERAWYRWAARNPALAQDPHIAFDAGIDFGDSIRLAGTTGWSEIVPVMRDTLAALERAETWFALLREPVSAMTVPADDEDLEDLPF